MTRFASGVSNLRSSQIRDLMSLATRPGIISFAGGMPGNELFPLAEMDEIYNDLTEREKQVAMQYGPTCGLPSLIESLNSYLKEKGLPVDTHKLLITTGSLQAINILANAFIDAGDSVITENPSFIGALSAFKSYSADIQTVDLDSDGISLEKLALKLDSMERKPKFLYITPTFHNPAGMLYSKERRIALIEMMKDRDIPVIEDDAYGDLYFYEDDLEDIRPMIAYPHEGVEICYTGSFSKIIGPGLRLGYMLVPPHIYDKCELIKQSVDACSPSFTQVIADKFIRSGAVKKYLNEVRQEYKLRAEAMHKALKSSMPEYVSWNKPQGGFYVWVKLPKGINSMSLLKPAIDKGVVFVAGSTFDPYAAKDDCLRISYCNTPVEVINKGVPIIAEAIKDAYKQLELK